MGVPQVGEIIGLIHKSHIIHGDLTTSNFIVLPTKCGEKIEIAIIDFGLSSVSEKAEEKGVDLYVLERAFVSTHPLLESRYLFFSVICSIMIISTGMNIS